MKTAFGIKAVSKRGLDRRYDGTHFGPDVRCVELIDYVGTGTDFVTSPGNAYGVEYCRGESFYRCFADTVFDSPAIVYGGEFPMAAYKSNGDPIMPEGFEKLNFAGFFQNSNISVLPQGFSKTLVGSLNNAFSGCKYLKHHTPQGLRALGLCDVKDPAAPRILRSNGLMEMSFLSQLEPTSMKYMFKGCTAYNGHALNAIDWRYLESDNAAEGFAEGCRFEKVFLDGLIASIHWAAIQHPNPHKPPVRKLKGVNLGHGRLVGVAATHYHQLRERGIEIIVEAP